VDKIHIHDVIVEAMRREASSFSTYSTSLQKLILKKNENLALYY
jgi:hypothetical protein